MRLDVRSIEVLLVRYGILLPQPGTDFLAPNRSPLVNTEFLRHRLTCFSEQGTGSFISDLSQWRYVSSNGEDDGSSAREAGKSVMLHA